MNQILSTKLSKKSPQRKIWFRFQFIISVSIMVMLILYGVYYFYYLEKKEEISSNLIANYNIYKLYQDTKQIENESKEETSNGLFGIIEIPKINLYYPVFSELSEELLRVAPCKFYGNTPDVNGNICIAGHNYDNSLFFSKISTLSKKDEIYIFNHNKKYIYWITDIYEVEESDLSPIFNYDKNEKILTLVTCNNLNANRIILKAKQS